MELTANEASQLNDLCWHWDAAYKISHADDLYVAHRIGYPEDLLTAETASDLRELIRKDYSKWQASLSERSSL